MGYKGGGRIWAPWWRQTAADAKIGARIKEILEEAWERRRLESGRCGGRGDHQVADNGEVVAGDREEA